MSPRDKNVRRKNKLCERLFLLQTKFPVMTISPLTTVDWLSLRLAKQLHTTTHRIVSSETVKILEAVEVSTNKLQDR